MGDSKAANILVVDDEERMCRSLHALLTKAGYQVQTAPDGRQALNTWHKQPFDLVITDIKLPNMDGIELLQELRKADPEAMVILMTAYASLDTALAAINMGAYDYLMKPIEFTHLKLAVRRALEKRELTIARQKLLAELQETNASLERHVAEVNALYQAGLSLSQSQSLNSLLTKIIELALEVIGASVGSVMLLDKERSELRIAAAVGIREDVQRKTRVKLGNSIAGHVAQTGKPLLIKDIRNDPQFGRFSKGGYESNSALCAPLKIKEQMLGVINLSDPRTGEEFAENDLRLLVTFAAQAAIAINDADNFEQARQKLRQFEVLYGIASRLSNIDDSSELTSLIYNALKEIIDLDFIVWLSWAERSELLTFNVWEGFGKDKTAQLIGSEISLKDKTVFSTAVRTKMIKQKIESVKGLERQVKTLTAIPIVTKGTLYGLFCLGSQRENAFSTNDEDIASIVASQATSIYERQRAILNATRLLAMGRMISEISHDLKKPLTNIRGSLQIVKQRWPEIAQSDDFFSTADQEMLRLNELLKELVDFSNPKKYQLEQKRIPDLVKRIHRLVANDLEKKKIRLKQEFEEGLPSVMVNENEIVELLLNLILNAIDAMPDGGKLTITANRETESGSQKPFIKLQISDTGVGIPPEVKHRVFDRYFTTKETGTGLGLAICERIIMAHNGRIDLESKPGEGTTFMIWLPSA